MYVADINYLLAVDLDGGGAGAADRETIGEDAWSIRAERRILSAPVVAGDTVYFGSADGHLYAVDALNGAPRWKWRAMSPGRSSPAVLDGVVFFADADGWVYAVGG
jgi:outer membrane protein assembly factor BamB